MALRSKTNPYPGINIHLNSYLQAHPDEWVSYHSDHLTNLREYLDRNLPDNYYAKSESSLQISGFDAGTGSEVKDKVRPDINIFHERDTETNTTQVADNYQMSPTGSFSILETIDIDEDDPLGLVVYKIEDTKEKDSPVARIELLSPANKIGGTYYKTYVSKRLKTLEAGLVLVEIDYLHASRPVIPNLPSYSAREKNSYPYYVLVSHPHPNLSDGKAIIYAWHVNEPLPSFPMPLLESDQVVIELGKVYNYTYETTRSFHRHLNYAESPINYDTYNEVDQQKITAILANIRKQLEDS